MANRILHELVIDKIAAVDNPCQEHATVALMKRAESELDIFYKRTFSDKQRKDMADKGQAMSDGSFPIASEKDVENAVRDWGRAGSKPAVKAHIISRAKSLGCTDCLPEDWVKKMAFDNAQRTILKLKMDVLKANGMLIEGLSGGRKMPKSHKTSRNSQPITKT